MPILYKDGISCSVDVSQKKVMLEGGWSETPQDKPPVVESVTVELESKEILANPSVKRVPRPRKGLGDD